MIRSIRFLIAGAPLLIAASAPAGQGLDTPTLLLVMTAIVGVVVLRGVLLRRHLRKRRPGRRADGASAMVDGDSGGGGAGDCGDGGASCD